MTSFYFPALFRFALRPLAQTSRALPCRLALAVRRPSVRLALFLPAAGRSDGAARLRIYNMAEGLGRHGWASLVVPPTLTLAQRRRLIGAPVSSRPRPPQAGRPPVVVWAQTRPMTYIREAAFVRGIMARVAVVHGDVRLRLCDGLKGDDSAFAESFGAAEIPTEWVPRASYSRYLAGFDDSAVGLAPLCSETPFSRGKSIGKVLAYFDRKVPVIASAAGEHGRVFAPDTGVVSNDPGLWAAEILRLLDDAPARQAMADAAFRRFETGFSLPVTAASVAGILDEVAGTCARHRPFSDTVSLSA